MPLGLETIRACLDGAIPGVIATCSADGTPNAAYLSQVHYVDPQHVALSFQFFNETRRNILANPRATVQVIDPDTGAHYRLSLRYLRTETEGPLFESMKARLAGIASHTGMSKVFRLRGSDVYRVEGIEQAPGHGLLRAPVRRARLGDLRRCLERLSRSLDLATLLDELMVSLQEELEIDHAMLLLLDETGERLYTVASRGYPESGVGSEILLGEGIIGVAAAQRTPIRIAHMAEEYLYSRAMRRHMLEGAGASELELEIPLPGLPESNSQLAVPVVRRDRLLGVLYAESGQDMRFSYEDEDALVCVAQHLALAMRPGGIAGAASEIDKGAGARDHPAGGAPITLRRYACNDSIFIDDAYLIKGVAGAILWRLAREYRASGRTEFSNRELRLDPRIPLPDVSSNLEARLILLQRRLAERCPDLGIERVGRGRFRLRVDRLLELIEVA
ncbi:MAG: GAF domain-containing protein [Bdellovibrio bacteriovorus]